MGNCPCLQGLAGNFGPPPKLKTGYWAFRGLGAPMRMICAYAGADCEDIKYEVQQRKSSSGLTWRSKDWEVTTKPELKQTNPFITLPFVQNKDTGEVVTIANGVYLYLGRLYQLNGASTAEQVRNEQVLFQAQGLSQSITDLVYPFRLHKTETDFLKALGPFFKETVASFHDRFEAHLEQEDRTFFVAKTPCVADFFVWELLDQLEAMAERHQISSPIQGYDKLHHFYTELRNLNQLQSYFASEDYTLPMNNKMAYFL